jgi:thiol-disulfide isomerase/thioredoxin
MRTVAAFFAAVIFLSMTTPSSAARAVVGAAAPRFRIDDLEGGKVDLLALRGRPVFLNFFATWCAPCKLELPYIVKAFPNYGGRVTFVGIDEQETPEAVKAFARRMGIGYTVGIDEGNVAADYLVGAIPVSVFIDASGTIRAVNHGYLTPGLLRQDLGIISGH